MPILVMAINPEAPPQEPDEAGQVDRGALWWTTMAITGPACWFFLTWLWHGQSIVTSAGESLGAAAVLLLLVAVIGVSRQGRQQ
jgi:hypothetical protein